MGKATSIETMADQRGVTEVEVIGNMDTPHATLLDNNHADLCTKRNGKWMAFMSVLAFAVGTFVLVTLTYREALEVNSEGTLQSTSSHEAVKVGLAKTFFSDLRDPA